MLELTLNSINSSGIKVSEIYQEESESESQEKDLKNKDQTNGTHLSNTSMLNPLPIDSQKKLKFQLDLHTLFKLSLLLFFF
jgi:hypothetical protein